MALQTDLLFITDLNKGVAVTELRPLLFTGDEEAHRFVVEVMRDGQAENLSGASVVGYFIRADEATVMLEGTVDSQGRAVVALKKNCYSIHGRYQLVIRVTQGDVKTTIFFADGYMRHTTSDTIIDEENVIPSLDDLLAQIAAMEEVIARANEAADRANEAADNAESGGSTGGGLPEVTEADDGMPLRVENGEYKVGKLQKNAVEGLITDLIMYGDALSTLEQTALTEDDKADIVNDTLSALAGADTSDTAIAALQSLVQTHDVKIINMSEAISMLQSEFNEFEESYIENFVRLVMRIVQIERNLGLQPPRNDTFDTTTELDGIYDNMFGQG